nr:hypothetical protein [Mycobacterium sp. 852014-52450_SCH5900713]
MLTIHAAPPGRPHDFCWGIDGEIAVPTTLVCDRPDCGCDRSHIGLNSHRASTTLMVREIDIDFDDLVTACSGYLQAAGWADEFGAGNAEAVAGQMATATADVATEYAAGTVLRAAFDHNRQQWNYTEE